MADARKIGQVIVPPLRRWVSVSVTSGLSRFWWNDCDSRLTSAAPRRTESTSARSAARAASQKPPRSGEPTPVLEAELTRGVDESAVQDHLGRIGIGTKLREGGLHRLRFERFGDQCVANGSARRIDGLASRAKRGVMHLPNASHRRRDVGLAGQRIGTARMADLHEASCP
jgi:hypothetical protein